jgi:predicted MPP superfamily phosphohydrolase
VPTRPARRPPRRKQKRRWRPLAIGAAVIAVLLAVVAYGYSEALRDPVIRSIRLATPDWPRNVPPIRMVLVSDTHVQDPDMPPSRLARIVSQINKLEPDIIVLAGDYNASSYLPTRTYSLAEAVQPLASLKAKTAKIAVLGNHDREDPAESRAALESVGLTVLENEAIQIGPVAIGAIHWAFKKAINQLREREGMKILVGHSPDPYARLPDDISLMLAGHTHCGQIVLPLIGALVTGSKYGRLYMCGVIERPANRLIVSAGLGTSRVPLRLGAPPDIWLISLEPAQPTATPLH